MKLLFSVPAAVLLVMVHSVASAQSSVDIASCYEHRSISLPPKDKDEREALQFQGTNRAVIVLVDETAVLPDQVQQQAVKLNENLFKPYLADTGRAGMFYQALKFSTFSDTKFSATMVKGVLEGGVSLSRQGEARLPGSKVTRLKATLKNLNTCLGQQAKFGLDNSNQAIAAALKSASSTVPRSDILTAMQQVGAIFRDRKEAEKILIVVSDMMEHSAYTTFYDKQGDLKDIDAASELDNVQKKNVLADLKDVKVWVLGGGFFASSKQGDTARSRDPRKVAALESFWRDYFKLAKADLKEFGKPALLGQLP
jgi:hypothetical protein